MYVRMYVRTYVCMYVCVRVRTCALSGEWMSKIILSCTKQFTLK